VTRFLLLATVLLLAVGLTSSAAARVGTGVAIQMEPPDSEAEMGRLFKWS